MRIFNNINETKIKQANKQLLEGSRAGKIEVVLKALERGADVNTKSAKKPSLGSRLSRLIPDPLEDEVEAGEMTPLMHAAKKQSKEIMRLLISKGANIEARDEYGCTALMYALGALSVGAVGLLLESGADMYAKDHDGETVRSYATEEMWEVMVRYQESKKFKEKAKEQESALGTKQKIDEIIESLDEDLRKE